MIKEEEIDKLNTATQTTSKSIPVVIDSTFILQHRNGEMGKKLFFKETAKSNFQEIILPWILEGKMPDAAWKRLNSATSDGRSLSGRFKKSFSSSSSSSNNKVVAETLFSAQIKASIKILLLPRELSQQEETEIEKHCTEQVIRSIDRPPLRVPSWDKLHKFIRLLNQAEKEQPKVTCFIQWLKNKFDPKKEKHINKLYNFFIIYGVIKKIKNYGFAIQGDDNGELLKKLNSMIEEYFVKGFKVPEALPEEFQMFNAAYDSLSKNKKTKWVGSFFEDWFANNVEINNDDDGDEIKADNERRAELFCMLCSPEYQASIQISEQAMKDGFREYNGAGNDGAAATENGVYFSNLCLLYALTVPVREWPQVLHTILQKLSKKPNACPRELLQQINYLLECYVASGEVERRPEIVVLTPALIKTAGDVQTAFNYIATTAAHGHWPTQFIQDAIGAVKAKIKSISGGDLMAYLSLSTNDTYRLLIAQELVDKLESFDSEETIRLIPMFKEDSTRLKVLKMFAQKLPSLLYEDALQLFFLFKYDQHPRVLKLIKHRLPNFLEETAKIISIFTSDVRRLRALRIVRGNLPSLTCEATIKLISLFNSEDDRRKALKIIQTKLPIFDKKETDLVLAQFKTVGKRQEVSAFLAGSNASKQDKSKEAVFGDNLDEFCSWVKTLSEKAKITGVKFLQELCIECKNMLSSATSAPTFFRSDVKEQYKIAFEKLFDFIMADKTISIQDAVGYLSRLLDVNGKKISDIGRMLKAASKAVLTHYEVSVSEDSASVSAAENEDVASTSVVANENEDEASASSSSYTSHS